MSTRLAPVLGDQEKESLTRSERSDVSAHLMARAGACDDEDQREELLADVVILNAEVAEAVAARYRNRGVPDDDLCQAAYEGLVKAVNRFDPSLKHDLLSYAVPTIRGEVQRYFRDNGWTVRPPRRLQDLQWRLHRAIEELSQELGREPRTTELIERLGIDEDELGEALQAYGSFAPASLDQPVGDSQTATRGDLIPDERDERSASEARMVLGPVVRALPERDRRILYLRFCEDLTQEEIGAELGVTQMQVSRLLTRIFRDLRRELTAGVPPVAVGE
jgi:RNA polymerase sigma-B factor